MNKMVRRVRRYLAWRHLRREIAETRARFERVRFRVELMEQLGREARQ